LPIRNANLIKTMAIAISVGARNRRSTKPSRTPFRRPIRFQSSSRWRAGRNCRSCPLLFKGAIPRIILERHTDRPILVINGRAHSRHHSGKRSARPSTQRYSIATVRFSVQPSSRCTNAAVHSKRVVRSKKLMIGTLPSCCARAASGHRRPRGHLVSSH
jgi:hypothetical protein